MKSGKKFVFLFFFLKNSTVSKEKKIIYLIFVSSCFLELEALCPIPLFKYEQLFFQVSMEVANGESAWNGVEILLLTLIAESMNFK